MGNPTHDPFGQKFAPTRKKLESVFGYSCTCVPSILSGRWPVEHRNWCYFVYDPKHSPFASLRWMRWLPTAVTSRRIFRRYLTKFVKVQLNFRGYFDLYNIAFKYIHLFDFTEKKSPLQPGGMNRGPNIFDFLTEQRIPYFVTDTTRTEEQNRDDLIAAVEGERVDFVFQYWAGLDGLLHMVGNQSPEVPARLRVDALRGMDEVTGFTFTRVEGHGAQDSHDPRLSARDLVVGYTPHVRVDIVLEDESVEAVLRRCVRAIAARRDAACTGSQR